MDKETVTTRLIALRSWMRENGVRAFVLRDVTSIAWLTGFEGVFDDERAHTLVVTQDKATVHTDSRYAAAMKSAATRMGKLIAVDTAAVGVSKFVENVLNASKTIAVTSGLSEAELAVRAAEDAKPFAIEDDITLAEFRALEKIAPAQATAPVETSEVVRKLRAVKTEAELERLRRAQQITDECFEHIKGFVKPGMTEREVQMEMNDYMLWSGAQALAFETIVAFGANAAKPHCVAGDTKLQAGQVLLLDFGAKFGGYCADMTRCIFLGKPSQPVQHVYDVVREANETVEAMLKPGVTGAEAHALAEKIIADGGFAGMMGHGLGHGVGMDIHEQPYVSPRNTEPFVAGNVVTVEPGIYLPEGKTTEINLPMGGKTKVPVIPPIGFRLEDCGVITDEGYQVFGRSSHDLAIV